MTLGRLVRAVGLRARALANALSYAMGFPVGLEVVGFNNLQQDPRDRARFCGEASDPQIYVAGVPGPGLSGSALVEFDIEVESGEALRRPVLYLRRSGVYHEADRVAVLRVGADRLAAFIPDLTRLDGLRFDPSEGPCDIRLTSVKFRGASEPPFVPTDYAEPAGAVLPEDIQRLADHTKLDGVRLLDAEGIVTTETFGAYRLAGNDPQMIFSLDETAFAGNVLLARITFYVGSTAGSLSGPRLYIDYAGEGFSQPRSFALAAQEESYVALIAFPHLVERIRWDPADRGGGQLHLSAVVAKPERLSYLQAAAAADDDRAERAAWADIASDVSASFNERFFNGGVALSYDYERWIKAHETPNAQDYERMRTMIKGFSRRPRFSFVMPTYNTPPDLLEACIQSMQTQIYPDFEICIADDCSSEPGVRETLQRIAASDPRIRLAFRAKNGHISRASNSALKLATGDYVVLVDHDDLVPAYALFVIAEALQHRPGAKILFSDEDKLGPDGRRCDPYFKGDFNEFLMFGHNMVSHLGVYDRALVEAVGGFRAGYEGSQDYDLLLRCAERCAPDQIVHVPHVLYHWRIIPGSTAMAADQKNYAIVAAQKAINSAFKRRGLPFKSVAGAAPGLTAVQMTVRDPTIVSIVIPTRDGLDLLEPCLASLEPLDATTQIVIVDNGSQRPETLAFLADFAIGPNRLVVRDDGPFNFSRLCNLGVATASGEIICLLNNDTELLSPGWLDRARSLLSLDTVGAVGARLIYPDGSLQHFGLVLGMGGHGVAGTPHRGIPVESFGSFGKARLLQEFSAVTAACMFVRKADYLAVGGFDTDLAVAYNDVDFCLKLRARGLKVVGDPEILLTHKESKSRGADTGEARAERLAGEAALMKERWSGVLGIDPYYSPNLTLARDDFSFAERPRVPWPWTLTS